MQKKLELSVFGARNYFFQVLTPYHREVLSLSLMTVYDQLKADITT